ncbi:MAG: CHAT domain-containing protein [Deltaproteobacteria bacterium]|jgi:CHAT domain-containing protein|nr:CHAT domain-containing protein [Deltaproteobacteria bacterium]
MEELSQERRVERLEQTALRGRALLEAQSAREARHVLTPCLAEADSLGVPEHAARIAHDLGCAHAMLGAYGSAMPLHDRAAKAFASEGGPDDHAALDATLFMAVDLLGLGRNEEAAELLARTGEAMERVLGPEDGRTLHCLSTLALALLESGSPEAAETAAARAAEGRTRTLGESHPLTLVSRDILKRISMAVRGEAFQQPARPAPMTMAERDSGIQMGNLFRALTGMKTDRDRTLGNPDDWYGEDDDWDEEDDDRYGEDDDWDEEDEEDDDRYGEDDDWDEEDDDRYGEEGYWDEEDDDRYGEEGGAGYPDMPEAGTPDKDDRPAVARPGAPGLGAPRPALESPAPAMTMSGKEYQRALADLTGELDSLSLKLGPCSPGTLRARRWLGWILVRAGKPEDAIDQFALALEGAVRTVGEDSCETALAAAGLAGSYAACSKVPASAFALKCAATLHLPAGRRTWDRLAREGQLAAEWALHVEGAGMRLSSLLLDEKKYGEVLAALSAVKLTAAVGAVLGPPLPQDGQLEAARRAEESRSALEMARLRRLAEKVAGLGASEESWAWGGMSEGELLEEERRNLELQEQGKLLGAGEAAPGCGTSTAAGGGASSPAAGGKPEAGAGRQEPATPSGATVVDPAIMSAAKAAELAAVTTARVAVDALWEYLPDSAVLASFRALAGEAAPDRGTTLHEPENTGRDTSRKTGAPQPARSVYRTFFRTLDYGISEISQGKEWAAGKTPSVPPAPKPKAPKVPKQIKMTNRERKAAAAAAWAAKKAAALAGPPSESEARASDSAADREKAVREEEAREKAAREAEEARARKAHNPSDGLNALRRSLSSAAEGTALVCLAQDRDVLRLTLVTPNGVSYGKDGSGLDEVAGLVRSFHAALRDPTSDAKHSSYEVYMVFMQMFDEQIRYEKLKNVVFLADGPLSYVPTAALWDGRQWLAEKIPSATITSFDLAKLMGLALPCGLQDIAGAYSYPVTRGGSDSCQQDPLVDENDFAPSAVRDTTDFMRRLWNFPEFRGRHAAFPNPIAHLPAERGGSRLALDDGARLDIFRELSSPALDLKGVEVLMLAGGGASCDPSENGGELDALGCLARMRGAGSVLTQLWTVKKEGDGTVPKAFARLHDAGMSRAKALQGAQLEVMRRKASGDVHARKNTTHPHFWASHVLLGDWT